MKTILTIMFIISCFLVLFTESFIISDDTQESHRVIRPQQSDVIKEIRGIFGELSSGSFVGAAKLKSFIEDVKQSQDLELQKQIARLLEDEILGDNNLCSRMALNVMEDLFPVLDTNLQNEIINFLIADYESSLVFSSELDLDEPVFSSSRARWRALHPLAKLIPKLSESEISKLDVELLRDATFYLVGRMSADDIEKAGKLIHYLDEEMQLGAIGRFFDLFAEKGTVYTDDTEIEKYSNLFIENLEYFDSEAIDHICDGFVSIMLMSTDKIGQKIAERVLDQLKNYVEDATIIKKIDFLLKFGKED